MLIAGIDEGGRGPIIGPMVMAICSIKRENEFKLQTLGVKDSKLLTPKRREGLFSVLHEICEVAVAIISPDQIDEAVLSSKDNLNWLEARTAADLINKIECDEVILDCPSTNLEAFKDYVWKKVNKKVKIIVEHKADLNHIIVAAASIIAKVTRDREIEKIKKKINKDFGSGYPSDPRTQDFIENNWKNKDYAVYMRKSWDTYKRRYHQDMQKSLGEF